ncbi:RHS repeat-associated core domain-containing protein, partial [Phocaeicola plebeius]|uniref:RHS repeat-associated core domain-containing protein n=1 Tax=Phocaeicola plebeius TaxID=310297 RepID=UPI00294333C2
NAKEFDEETGLYYYGARYYDPRLSLWISTDPLSELNSAITAYGYCSQNPVNRIDSDGNIDDPVEIFWKHGAYIDMAPAKSHTTTVKGFPRNSSYFWQEMINKHPEMLSEKNIALINANKSPIVDNIWVSHNPTHKNFVGEKLVHHHVEQGRFAVPIPEKVHQQASAKLHTIKAKKYNGRMTFRGLNSIFLIANAFSIFTDSPMSPLNIFVQPGTGTQNRAYIDFISGQIYEWSLGKGNIREVRLYQDYDRVNGKWRGTGLIKTQYFDEKGQEIFIH